MTSTLKNCFGKTVEQKQVHSLPTRGGDGVHNTVVFEDQTWSPVAFLNASGCGHEVVLTDVEVTTFNGQCNRLQVIED